MNRTSTVSCEQLLSSLPDLFKSVSGDPKANISRVASPDNAKPGSLCFCANPKAIAQGLESEATALVLPVKAATEVESKRGNKTLIFASNVERAMAATINKYFLETPYKDNSVDGVHPTAIVHKSAEIGTGVRVGPHAFIGAGTKLGANVFIGANAVVEANVTVGENTVIHPLAYVGHGSQIGARCELLPNSTVATEGFGYAHDEKGNHYRIPHQGIVVLEDGVHLGANSTIDRATFHETRIGAGTIIDNMCHIAHNCKVGRNSVLVAKFGMAGSAKAGANFVAGGDTNVIGHIEICDQVTIAGMSGVTKSITEPGQYGGYPLVSLQQYLKTKAAMANLPEMRKQLSALVKKFLPEESGN
jgi:UDP-3-O-[3-hydroxymyristoyl] glucosamine N-acyltransferase